MRLNHLFIALMAAVLCACASAQNGAAAAPKGKMNATAEEAAEHCFTLMMNGFGEQFYDDCVIKNTTGVASEVRKSRWERIATAAARKVGAAGGIVGKDISCQHEGSRAVCEIAYELAQSANKLRVHMPLLKDEAGNWVIIR